MVIVMIVVVVMTIVLIIMMISTMMMMMEMYYVSEAAVVVSVLYDMPVCTVIGRKFGLLFVGILCVWMKAVRAECFVLCVYMRSFVTYTLYQIWG
jgi:hypothetical protein